MQQWRDWAEWRFEAAPFIILWSPISLRQEWACSLKLPICDEGEKKKKNLLCNQMLQSQLESLTKVTNNPINAWTKQKQEDLDSFKGHEQDVCCHLLHSHDKNKDRTKNTPDLRRQLSGLPSGSPETTRWELRSFLQWGNSLILCELSLTRNDSHISYW